MKIRPYKEMKRAALLAFEKKYVRRVLLKTGGNLSAAARLARVDRKHLWRVMRRVAGMKPRKRKK